MSFVVVVSYFNTKDRNYFQFPASILKYFFKQTNLTLFLFCSFKKIVILLWCEIKDTKKWQKYHSFYLYNVFKNVCTNIKQFRCINVVYWIFTIIFNIKIDFIIFNKNTIKQRKYIACIFWVSATIIAHTNILVNLTTIPR